MSVSSQPINLRTHSLAASSIAGPVSIVTSMAELTRSIETLDSLVADAPGSLVVVDSIAALARLDFDLADLPARQALLSRLSAHMKRVASIADCVILVTNQVTTADGTRSGASATRSASSSSASSSSAPVDDSDAAENPSEVADDLSLIPALGNTWSHCINVRLVFEYLPAESTEGHPCADARVPRRARVVKSPLVGATELPFRIDATGVVDVACGE